MEINEISGSIVDAAMKVHTALGPGLLDELSISQTAFEDSFNHFQSSVLPPLRLWFDLLHFLEAGDQLLRKTLFRF